MTLPGQLEASSDPDLSGCARIQGQDPARVGPAIRGERRADERSIPKAADLVSGIADQPHAPVRRGSQRDLLIWTQAFALGEGGHLVLAKPIQAAGRPEPEVAFPVLHRRIHEASRKVVLDPKPIGRRVPADVTHTPQTTGDEADP